MPIMLHPMKDDHGKPVVLHKPSQPTPLDTWANPKALAVVVPQGAMPTSINGVTVARWDDAPTTLEGWEALAAAHPLDEPPFVAPAGYQKAAGAVVVESDGRTWAVAPSNKFAGYSSTYPKGKTDGKSAKSTALAEVFEESGLQIRLTKFLVDVKRTTSYTRYFLAERTGGDPSEMCFESQAVMLIPRSMLAKVIGHPSDKPILEALDRALCLAVDGVGGVNYLGDAALVNQLVRDFMARVFSARARFHQDGDGKAADARIASLCQQYGAVFMGESQVYQPMPWNSPHRLGNLLRVVVEDVGEFPSPGEAYFNFLALQALQASIALETDTMTEDRVKAELTTVVDDAVDVLLGRKGGGGA